MVRKSARFFFFATLAALALRMLFLLRFPTITNDSFVYGDIAKNWLRHGIYGLSGPQGITPTLLRLPGYPALLAAVFTVFGMEHYHAVLWVQVGIDLGTCFLLADMARRLLSARAAKTAFLLAGLCPFLANYAAAALTETPEIFCTALALDSALAGFDSAEGRRRWPWVCGVAIGGAIMLRPDGGLLLLITEAYLAGLVVDALRVRSWERVRRHGSAAFIIGCLAVAPLVPWTWRNLRTLHRFQPLAPRYAIDEDEFVPLGYNRWVRTWMVEYTSVEEIYWSIPGDTVDPGKLPARAFDSEEQRQQTIRLLEAYNGSLHLDRALDAEFSKLADRRIRDHPLRYYLRLPVLRILDMWLRPRTEILPSDPRWWEFNDDPRWSALAVGLGLIGLFYVGAACVGLTQLGLTTESGLLVAFVALRSAFLGTLENPEPRYTLEMYPVLIVFAASTAKHLRRHFLTNSHEQT
jgi:4-amino-4-deoxy-L-arabinose transferase-like glycosyltransferase